MLSHCGAKLLPPVAGGDRAERHAVLRVRPPSEALQPVGVPVVRHTDPAHDYQLGNRCPPAANARRACANNAVVSSALTLKHPPHVIKRVEAEPAPPPIRDGYDSAPWAVLGEWDNGAPQPAAHVDSDAVAQTYLDEFDRRREAERQQRADLVSSHYDEKRERTRLAMIRVEADAAFFAHVLEAPASPAQRDKAEERLSERRAAAQELRAELGDPEEVIDCCGQRPAQRRDMNLNSHMTFWRHPMLRELHSSKQRNQFKALLAMRPIKPADMCSECQAPSQWHEYALSLCLFRPAPAPGSPAEKIATLMPGWWQRCSACTTYQMEYQWGGQRALPDFDGEHWVAMLPPMFKAVFAPDPPKPRQRLVRRKPLAVIAAADIDDVLTQLSDAKTRSQAPEVRSGPHGTWELWPDT